MSFVTGIGRTNIDLLYSGMPRLPKEGEEIYSQDFSLQLGGGVPATLINTARLGVPSRPITYLGDELFSSYAREQFARNGVQPVNLFHGQGMPLNVTSVAITPANRTFISYGGKAAVDDRLLSEAFDAQRGAKVVVIHEDFLPIYPELKRQGAILVYDTGWDESMSVESMQDIFKLADYYTPNRQEAMLITGEPTPEAAARALSRYFTRAIVKVDQDGCLMCSGDEMTRVASVPGVNCVDSTGAGDAFLSGFIYGLYHDMPCARAVACGNIMGAVCVTKVGCLSARIDESELLRRLNAHYPE